MFRNNPLPASRVNWILSQLERVGPMLFFVASIILFVAAAHRGALLLFDGLTHNPWVEAMKLVGRLIVLLAIAGLAVNIGDHHSRFGTVCRATVFTAILFTLALVGIVILETVGVSAGPPTIVGFGAYVLAVGTYLVFGVAIIRTGAYTASAGILLVVAAVTLMAVFLGQMVLPIEVVGVLAESTLFGIYLTTGLVLRARRTPSRRPASLPELSP